MSLPHAISACPCSHNRRLPAPAPPPGAWAAPAGWGRPGGRSRAGGGGGAPGPGRGGRRPQGGKPAPGAPTHAEPRERGPLPPTVQHLVVAANQTGSVLETEIAGPEHGARLDAED